MDQHQPIETKRAPAGQMIDPFGRAVTYLRVSVTDRCDFRCVYCMAEHMTFLPKKEILTLEELDRVCKAFMRKGVRKIRLTGGELGLLSAMAQKVSAAEIRHFLGCAFAHRVVIFIHLVFTFWWYKFFIK